METLPKGVLDRRRRMSLPHDIHGRLALDVVCSLDTGFEGPRGGRVSTLALWPRCHCPLSLAALAYLPLEVLGDSSLLQASEGLIAGVLGPLPHAAAHGFQGTAQALVRPPRGSLPSWSCPRRWWQELSQQPDTSATHTLSVMSGPWLRRGLGSRISHLLWFFASKPVISSPSQGSSPFSP